MSQDESFIWDWGALSSIQSNAIASIWVKASLCSLLCYYWAGIQWHSMCMHSFPGRISFSLVRTSMSCLWTCIGIRREDADFCTVSHHSHQVPVRRNCCIFFFNQIVQFRNLIETNKRFNKPMSFCFPSIMPFIGSKNFYDTLLILKSRHLENLVQTFQLDGIECV